MLTAWYIGDHSKDGFMARLGYALIRLGQIGQKYGKATHCEGIVMGPWWHCTIAGASRRDGAQVRFKTVELTPGHWVILDVPQWDVVAFTAEAEKLAGTRYSDIGAASSASMLVGLIVRLAGVQVAELGQWCSRFILDCNKVQGAEDMSVSEAMTLALALPGTRDVTSEFFSPTKTGTAE